MSRQCRKWSDSRFIVSDGVGLRARTANARSIAYGWGCMLYRGDTSHETGVRPLLRATGSVPPPFKADRNFNDPEQPVAGVLVRGGPLLRMASSQTGRAFGLPSEAESECAARGGLEQKEFPWGDATPDSQPDYGKRWQTGPEAVGALRGQSFRSLRHRRQCARMVQRLVRPELLFDLRGQESARSRAEPDEARAKIFSRRIMASSHQSGPMLGALQYPAGFPLCRLRDFVSRAKPSKRLRAPACHCESSRRLL